MAYLIHLGDKTFNTKKAALDFLSNIRIELFKNTQTITEGNNFELLKDLYQRYCDKTNWKVPGEIIAFSTKNEGRGVGSAGGTTQALYVICDNDPSIPIVFSAQKAINAIAIKI